MRRGHHPREPGCVVEVREAVAAFACGAWAESAGHQVCGQLVALQEDGPQERGLQRERKQPPEIRRRVVECLADGEDDREDQAVDDLAGEVAGELR